MHTRTLIVDLKGKRYKLRLISGEVDIIAKLNIHIHMPDIIVGGLENGDEIWEMLISLPDNEAMRNLLPSLTSEFYQDRRIVFMIDTITGFKPDTFVLRLSKRDIINGIVCKLEEIVRVPVLNIKLKRSTPW